MTQTQQLIAAIVALSSTVTFLFTIWNTAQGKRISACEKQRAEQQNTIFSLQQQLAEVWKSLYQAEITKSNKAQP